ncbi:MAG: hypothetical protein GXP49_17055 [Deltaproteobacteria bacterium]|nr:hypothetical protein [Deltaproteobacteria bacterium]
MARKRNPGRHEQSTGESDGKHRSRNERKDRLVQTRITPSLYQQVLQRARLLKIPVSNLIRIVLEDSLHLVDGVVEESVNIAEALSAGDNTPSKQGPGPGQAPRSNTPAVAVSFVRNRSIEAEQPVAWQTVTLNRRLACGKCGTTMYPGQDVQMGLAPDGRPLFFACTGCYEAAIALARKKDPA